MQPIFKAIAEHVALICELLTVVLLALGALEAAVGLTRRAARRGEFQAMKLVWLRFASRIALALELALAADIVRTAISPNWNDIGQLAAIALIRTALNLFLERDIESFRGSAVVAGDPP